MKTLNEYLQEVTDNSKSKYIAVIYDSETQRNLKEYCEKYGFDLTVDYDGNRQQPEDFEFHSTIFFTTSKHILSNEIQQIDKKEVIPTKIEYLGENYDIPVLKIKSDSIDELRKHYEDEYDMKDKWDEYKPHISLSYNTEIHPDPNKIPLPTFPIYFDKIKIDDGETDV